MFEQEIEMEKKEGSGFGPLLIILLLVGLFVGGIGIVVYQGKQAVKADEASAIIQQKLARTPPVTVSFSTGNVSYGAADAPTQPQYKLLATAGYLKIGKGKGWAEQVDLTPAGKAFFDSIPGVSTMPDKGGMTIYRVPLAHMKLVSTGAVTKVATHRCSVQYTWGWETTKAGDLFDIAGKPVQNLPTYDRSMLIDQHGANYYHNPPSQSAISVVKGDKGWEEAGS
ncbi:MAG: hypothetical protein P4M01_04945 [Acidobacteriota bacterium]|nr:hypothetical protein [Acidobacteriota bacterium]